MITFIMPSASAASVPGRMRTCQSAFLAVRVETGSTTTTLAPRACASAMNGQWCKLLLMVLMAQRMMYFEWTKLSGSTAAVGPQDIKKALIAPESQNVRSDTTAPSLLKNASSKISSWEVTMELGDS